MNLHVILIIYVDILHFFHIHFLTKFLKLNQQFDIFVLNNYLQKIRFKLQIYTEHEVT